MSIPETRHLWRFRVRDGAEQGCWTNIGEARTYAEDKLADIGYEVRGEDEPVHILFDIVILSTRSGGYCYGNIDIEVLAPSELVWSDGNAYGVVGGHGGIFRGYQNANYLMLDYVKEMIDEMESNAENSTFTPDHKVSDEVAESET